MKDFLVALLASPVGLTHPGWTRPRPSLIARLAGLWRGGPAPEALDSLSDARLRDVGLERRDIHGIALRELDRLRLSGRHWLL